ncbi:hypothetical protein N9B31_09030 [Mariniblastus sp.]|nr:hypothetical protein [Mariniblastus sp.]
MPKARPELFLGESCSLEDTLKAIPKAIGRAPNLGNAVLMVGVESLSQWLNQLIEYGNRTPSDFAIFAF